LFLLPLAVAFWMYYGSQWRPAAHVNHGELITPARPLPGVELPHALAAGSSSGLFRKKWTLVYIGEGHCDETCHRALYVMRQVRLLLNQEMTRVARAFLVTGNCCDRDYLDREQAGLEVLDAQADTGATLLSRFPMTERAHSLYIVDPQGNLMMRYDIRQDPKGLLEDLKKLLSLSHIG